MHKSFDDVPVPELERAWSANYSKKEIGEALLAMKTEGYVFMTRSGAGLSQKGRKAYNKERKRRKDVGAQ
jgi:hypothetical protein